MSLRLKASKACKDGLIDRVVRSKSISERLRGKTGKVDLDPGVDSGFPSLLYKSC